MAVDLQRPFGGTTCYERAQHGVAPGGWVTRHGCRLHARIEIHARDSGNASQVSGEQNYVVRVSHRDGRDIEGIEVCREWNAALLIAVVVFVALLVIITLIVTASLSSKLDLGLTGAPHRKTAERDRAAI